MMSCRLNAQTVSVTCGALGSDERQDRERLQTSVMNVTTSTVNTFVLLTVDSLDLQSI